MAVAMVMEAEEDAVASAAGENRISAAVAMPAELVVTTAEPGAVGLAAAMARGLTHPESQRKATVAMHREARPEGKFMVLARDRKIEPLPSSLRGLQIGLEVTTFPVINLALALRVNPAPSNALAQLQRVQPGPAGLGRDRMPPTGSDSTRKQNKGCVTGRAKHLVE